MPFTFLHPAVVVPARYLPAGWRKYVSMTGLVAGSVAPDFEKFIRMKGGNLYSHTLSGIGWFDLPVSVVVALLFHQLVRDVCLRHLPAAWSARLAPYYQQNWPLYFRHHYVVVLSSMLLGIALHLGLDSATHSTGKAVRLLPLLRTTYGFGSLDIAAYQVLEVLYYLLALALLYGSWLALPPGRPSHVRERDKWYFWGIVVIGASLLGGLRLLVNPQVRHIWDLGNLITSSLLGSLLLTCWWQRLSHHARHQSLH